jgi:hypothetical protein
MKIKWSYILVIAMAVFIVMVVAMGIKMASSSSELYETDYYEKGEDHATRMQEEALAKQVNLTFERNESQLRVEFLNGAGEVHEIRCLKLSDSKSDFIINVEKETIKEKTFPITLSTGIWVIELKGVINKENFFKKLELTI